jgi:hypothetical protein
VSFWWGRPETTASIDEDSGESSHLILDAEDRGSPENGEVPSSVGITYYWINGSGPRIYTAGPLPVELGDIVT